MRTRAADSATSLHCVLCAAPTSVRAIGAMIVTGDVARPEGAILCRHCAALPADERKRRRDAAMARMLREAPIQHDAASAMAARVTPPFA